MTTTLSYPEREKQLALQAVKSADAFHAAVSAGLKDEHFTVPVAGAIWSCVRELREIGRVVTGVEMVEKLRATRFLEDGRALLKQVPGLALEDEAAVVDHATKVVAAASARAASSTIDAALRELRATTDPQGALSAFLDTAFSVTLDQHQRATPQLTNEETLSGVWHELMNPAERRRTITGIPTHIHMLDEHTRGWQMGKVGIVAARPGVGKTAFVTSQTSKLIDKHDPAHAPMPPVLFLSLEMTKRELIVRLMVELSKIEMKRMLFGDMPDITDLQRLQLVSDKINRAPLDIDDSSSMTVEQIAAVIWRWLRRRWPKGTPPGAFGWVVLDYLTRIKRSRGIKTLQDHVTHCMDVLTTTAKDTGLPITVLSQLTRAHLGEGRMPDSSDLKGGGEIEENAYTVLILHPLGRQEDAQAGKPWRKLIMGLLEKNRSGEAPKMVPMHYEGAHYSFRGWNTHIDGDFADVLGQAAVPRGKPQQQYQRRPQKQQELKPPPDKAAAD